MRRLICIVFVSLSLVFPAAAQPREEVGSLYAALRMPEVIDIMQEEGIEYGADLHAEMFPGRDAAAWDALVARLYDRDAMGRLVQERFDALLGDTDLGSLTEFFTSERGARIVRLELEARRAMMEDGVEEAAQDSLRAMRNAGESRLDLLEGFVAANDLVESNVVGAMNANYAFYMGLMDGGAFQGDMTEEQLLADVWSQEPEIRTETIDWVFSYLALAYQPLEDDDISVYTALSLTPEGQALNRAVFGAFDTMYTTISRALGQGAAQFMQGEDL